MKMGPVVMAVALLAFAPSALAHQANKNDSIAVGNPYSKLAKGITETLAPCNTTSGLNGLDGYWYDITGFGTSPRHAASLTMAATLDADLHFYTEDCSYIGAGVGSCGQELVGTTEDCEVPSDSVYVIVVGAAGSGTFALAFS